MCSNSCAGSELACIEISSLVPGASAAKRLAAAGDNTVAVTTVKHGKNNCTSPASCTTVVVCTWTLPDQACASCCNCCMLLLLAEPAINPPHHAFDLDLILGRTNAQSRDPGLQQRCPAMTASCPIHHRDMVLRSAASLQVLRWCLSPRMAPCSC